MGNYLNIGNHGFASMRRGIYVDKTEMIAFVNSTLGTKDKLTCVSRPRRFGKSFAAQMLGAYYDKSCDSKELFSDLKIAAEDSFKRHLNKYNVISLDMTLMISNTEKKENIINNIEKKVISEIIRTYPDVTPEDSLIETLANVSTDTQEQFIVIIDEWDALFREAKDDIKLQEEYMKWLRGMFKSTLTDKAILGAYMTGILPIKKYGTQSAVSDFKEYTMLTPKKLEKYVGFCEDEVKALCEQYSINFTEMKRWYDGYSFHRIKSVYNPNSVMEAIKNEEFLSYWARTESYESLKIYIELNEDGLKEAIVQMMGGAHIPVDVETFRNDMTNIKRKDDVITLLIHLGYLAYDQTAKTAYIPNEEVRQEFVRAVVTGKHKEIAKLIEESDYLLEKTINMEEKTVAEIIEKAHSAGVSPLFYNNEQALRSVIRFAYISCMDDYQEIQELPTGTGYADVVFVPKKHTSKPAMIIELKWNKSVHSAIQQIKDRNYPQILQGFTDEILLVGINYDEKTKKHSCLIEKFMRGNQL
ncbi:MAG: AAA family ATPase [Lachnospiraceae bacterium]|nr:AAA family ATPase [Lachnospiraceae bacterium]